MSHGRISISETTPSGFTRVRIAPRRSIFGFVIAVLGFGILGVGIAGIVVGATTEGVPGLASKLVMAASLVVLIGFGHLWLFSAMWNLWGYWYLQVEKKRLTVTARLLSVSRTWIYSQPDITNVRIEEGRWRDGSTFCQIALDYRGKTKRVTPRLPPEDARRLFDGAFQGLKKGAARGKW